MYSRNLAGRELTFAASGWTWNGVFILQDLETGSLWFTGRGVAGNDRIVCVAGELQDSRLPRLESFRGYWKSWHGIYPQTLYLKSK